MKSNLIEGRETQELRGQGVGWLSSEDVEVPKNSDKRSIRESEVIPEPRCSRTKKE